MGTFAAHDGLIAGRYRLSGRIGRGGMGTVWRATDELLARQVAVKELHMDDGGYGACPSGLSDCDRTLREARAAALISHPNVVALHDIVVQDGRPWIVMELVDGRALSEVLAAEGPVGPRETARIAIALLSALRAAHACGVLHRDIKPPNVLLESATGRVVLTDFGVAQVRGATTITETGAFVGSPEYTAPERMSGGPAGPASDLWSLGVLMCAALSGVTPFRRDSLGGILHAVVHDEIRPPAAAAPLLPVVQGLLERDPARRMGADEAERLLHEYLASGWVDGGRVRPAYVPRSRTVLMSAVAVVTLAGTGAGLAVLLADRGAEGAGGRPTQVSSGTLGRSPGPPVTREPPVSAPVRPPEGYHAVQDPAGFALAVPDGFTRSFEPPRVFYYSRDRQFRLGILIQDPQGGGPAGTLRAAAAAAPDRYPGYRSATVREATHKGYPAASWEFTWDGPEAEAGGAVRTYDTCWEEGGKMYEVWVAGPAGKAAQARRHAQAVLDTFVRIRPVSSP
ncbi:serine/threonine protein kinase [Streptomyces rectiverticillatus]|uniref:serine/threonine-protein kinase n=1 Tax=Streptomyces rectiverticillatus TaxID=173860 RepID=UPI0015C378CD|nr:serine/threonine-protein kinase [Streptomyces rectiverticillatus]QLE73540.1 serine/threonine protein kinase [Streptomyces rectiverticillatus]